MSETERTQASSLELLRWIGWAQQQAADGWVRNRELSREQAFTLGFLVQHPGSIQRDVAEITRTSPASVTSLLQGLERRGLVERRTPAGNERTKRVYATDDGAELVSGFDTAMAEAEQSILSPLDADERSALHDLLLKITAALPRPTRS